MILSDFNLVINTLDKSYLMVLYDKAIRVYFHEHKYVLEPTKTRFSPRCKARANISSEKGPKHIYARKNLLLLLSL